MSIDRSSVKMKRDLFFEAVTITIPDLQTVDFLSCRGEGLNYDEINKVFYYLTGSKKKKNLKIINILSLLMIPLG